MKELGYLSLVFLLMGYLSRVSRLPSIHNAKCDLQYYFPLGDGAIRATSPILTLSR